MENESTERNLNSKTEAKKALKLPFISALVLSALLLVSLFLPYSSAIGEHREMLESGGDSMVTGDMNISYRDMEEISIARYAQVYWHQASNDYNRDVSIACLALFAAVALFVLMSVLFSALKKPVCIMVFTALNIAVYKLMSWDFKGRGIVPSDKFVHGFAYYLFYALSVLLIAVAIWMLIVKLKIHKKLYQ